MGRNVRILGIVILTIMFSLLISTLSITILEKLTKEYPFLGILLGIILAGILMGFFKNFIKDFCNIFEPSMRPVLAICIFISLVLVWPLTSAFSIVLGFLSLLCYMLLKILKVDRKSTVNVRNEKRKEPIDFMEESKRVLEE